MIFNMWCVYLPIAFNALLMEFYYCVQLDRLVKEFIVPLEKQISSEQEEKQVVEKEKETQEIVGQKRRARSCTGTCSTSNASTETVAAAGGTRRRSKRFKVAPTRYAPVVEEEVWTPSPHASSGVVISNTALTAAARPLDHSSATDETTMNVSNTDTNTGASRRVSAVAAVTMLHKRRKVCKTFDERFKELKAFKAKFGHCNVPTTQSNTNKYSSLGMWCSHVRTSYKAIKQGGTAPRNNKLSKADMKRLENAGFEWNLCKTFDERFKDLMAFKAKFGHCNVPKTQSSNNKYSSLGMWCGNMRLSCKAIKEGGTASRNCYKLSKADMKRLENAGFEWNLCKTFDERFKDLMAFKAEFGHCNVPRKRSSNNTHLSLGQWCGEVRRSYKAFIEGRGMVRCKVSKADIKRLEKAGFEWRFK
jgi:hypothetical protein